MTKNLTIVAIQAVFTVALFHNPALAQKTNTTEQSVTKVVMNLFDAMTKGDSALARSVFEKPVTTATVFRGKEGVVLERENSVEDFIKAIGTPHEQTWYEETWNLKTEIDGDFAVVWCDYAFYLGNTFSHCGVDAFHLVNTKEGWKIFHLADTRRKTACDIPENIQSKHR